jgi:hypothetical protein
VIPVGGEGLRLYDLDYKVVFNNGAHTFSVYTR